MFETLVTVVHIAVCIFLVLLVLLQQGKGADLGATFGGGGNTLFGASGADTLLTKVTTSVAILFMITSVTLAYNQKSRPMEHAETKLFKEAAAPAAAASTATTATTEAVVDQASAPADAPVANVSAEAAPVEATEAPTAE